MAGEKPATLGEQHLRYWARCGYHSPFVYVVGCEEFTPVKVGHTHDGVESRMRGLQTGCPYPLKVLHVIPGTQTLETWLHRHMRPLRLCGEWFDGPGLPDHLKRIGEMAVSMKAAHNEHGESAPPDFADFSGWIPCRIRRTEIRGGERTGFSTRFVEPRPMSEEEKLEKLRAHWMRPARAVEKGYAARKW